MIFPVPVEQLRREYVFLAPQGFVEDYVSIYGEIGTTVVLDGVVLDSAAFRTVADRYAVATHPIGDGVHRIEADAPGGVVVYGFDDDVSYGYPAGTGLSELW